MDARSKALLALGLILLSVPIWAPFLDLTGRDYVYERANVTIEGEEIVAERSSATWTTEDQIACFGYPHGLDERLCRLEGLLTTGNVTTSSTATIGGSPRAASVRYVVFDSQGRPYERTVSFNDTTDGYMLGLEPVSPQHVLEEVSDSTVHRPAVRRALETGSARAEESFFEWSGRLYETEDGYAVVYQSGTTQFLSEKPMVERGFEALFVAIGAVYVYHVGRREGLLEGDS